MRSKSNQEKSFGAFFFFFWQDFDSVDFRPRDLGVGILSEMFFYVQYFV